MAIRLEHQPIGIGGLAAYAVGRGRRKERDSKYATGLILQQQARSDRYNLLGQQQKFQKDRDAAARFEREGREVRARADAVDAAAREEERRERERDEGRTYAEGREELEIERDEFTDARDYARKVSSSLPDISDLDPDTRRKLQPYIETINTLATSSYDVSEPDTGAGFQDAVKGFYDAYNSIKKPSPGDRLNKGLSHYNPETGEFGPKTDTSIPFLDGKPLPINQPDETPPVPTTVPFRGQQVPIPIYEKEVAARQKAIEQYDNLLPDDRTGKRPEPLTSVMDLLYPEKPMPTSRGGRPANSLTGPLPTADPSAAGILYEQVPATDEPSRPTTLAEYDAMPKGTKYINLDGEMRTKGVDTQAPQPSAEQVAPSQQIARRAIQELRSRFPGGPHTMPPEAKRILEEAMGVLTP